VRTAVHWRRGVAWAAGVQTGGAGAAEGWLREAVRQASDGRGAYAWLRAWRVLRCTRPVAWRVAGAHGPAGERGGR